MVSTMSVKRMRPSWKASTASSFTALYTAMCVAEACAACLARRTAVNTCSSSGSNVQLAAVEKSQACAAPGTRCGQFMPSAIGRRMSGGEAWAITEPSMN